MADAFLRDASCPKQCALDHLCHLHLEMFAPLHRMPISWRAQQMLQICTRTTAAGLERHGAACSSLTYSCTRMAESMVDRRAHHSLHVHAACQPPDNLITAGSD